MRTHTAFLLLICFLTPLLFARPAASAPAEPKPVVVVDLTEADAPTRLALTCLEGIVNRQGEQPRLYCILQAADQILFDQIYAKRGYKAEKLAPAAAQERFAGSIKGQVLYDPAQPETINLATALAGLEDALPATAAAQIAGRRTVEDLRDRFHNRQEACQWALEKLAPRVNQQKFAILAPDQMGLRDYLVSEKILPVSLDPKQAEEAKLLVSLLDRFPAGALLFWDGHAGTPADTRAQIAKAPGSSLPALAQGHGKLLVPGAAAANFSFHARVPAYAPLHQVKRLVQHSPAKYVTFVFTGNGNLDFPLTRMRTLWDDEARGYMPLGWEIHPALVEMAPAVLSSYYADAWWGGSDQFVMAPSGGGCLAPSDPKALNELLSATGKAAKAADLTAVSVLEGNAEKPWNAFYRVPEVRGVLALGNTAAPTRISSRAFIGETVRVTDPEKAAQDITAAGAGQQFILAVVDADKVTPSQVATLAARLGQDYRVVFPYEFLDLLAERDALDHFDPQLAPLARIQSVTFTPTKPGPTDPITVKATISGGVVDARVVYTVNGSADFTEPLVWDGSIYRAVLPPVLRSGELKFRVRVADILLRTRWSGYCTLPVSAPDGDQDGLSDAQEKIYGLDPARADSDGDGLRDGNDPAPLFAFPRPKEQEGPTITGLATPPHTPPAGGKSGKLQALVFDPSGVTSVTASLSADGRSLGGGAMQEVRNSQIYEYSIPPLTAGQQLTAVLTATNGAGKVSTVKATLPVTLGVRITAPLDNYVAKSATTIRLDVSGKPSYLRILVNGYPVTKLTQPPYRYVWDPFPYQSGTHEILVEAYDAANHLIDADAVRIRYVSNRDHR